MSILSGAQWIAVTLVFLGIYCGFVFDTLVSILTFILAVIIISSEPPLSPPKSVSKMSTTDPYGLFHLELNKEYKSHDQPKTEWLNMGYWKNTTRFSEACEALALKLASAGNCHSGGHVLDVGHGCGDSLLLQLNHPAVPRPSSLTGITSLKVHYERALYRISMAQSSSQEAEKIAVSLYQTDAIYHKGDSASTHPLNPESEALKFTTILALDCAYHFHSRNEFLQQSLARLAPRGTIALADICFAPSSTKTLGVKLMQYIMGACSVMPKDNMVTAEEYLRELESMGYVDVKLEDITDDVFPGFITFLRSRGWKWTLFSYTIRLLATAGARFVIVSAKKPNSGQSI